MIDTRIFNSYKALLKSMFIYLITIHFIAIVNSSLIIITALDIKNVNNSFTSINGTNEYGKSDKTIELTGNLVQDDLLRWSSSINEEYYQDQYYSKVPPSSMNEILNATHSIVNKPHKLVYIKSINGNLVPYNLYLTDVIIPLYEIKNSLFVCKIKIGDPEQEFWPIIDTGSSNLWIIGNECNQPSCKKVKRYSKHLSKSFKRIPKYEDISVIFGTGKINGKLIFDTLKFSNFQLNEHVIGVIDRVENTENSKIDIFDAIELEGVLGLGFTQLSSSSKLQQPLIERLREEGLINENIFSLYINDYRIKPSIKSKYDSIGFFNLFNFRNNTTNSKHPSSPSALLLLGGIDRNLYEGEIHMLHVVRENYWQVEIESLHIGSTKYCCDRGSLAYEWDGLEKDHLKNKFGNMEDVPMEVYIYKRFKTKIDTINRTPGYIIFDSGTSFYTLPHFEYKHFIDKYKPYGDCSQIHLDKNSVDKSILDHFPNVTYTFKDGFKLVITPDLYLTPNEQGKCKPGFMSIDVPLEYGHSYLLGSLFMRSYFTIYAKNITNIGSSVGIAKAKHSVAIRKYIYSNLSKKDTSFISPDDDEAEQYWTKLNGRLSTEWKFTNILNNLMFA